MNELHYDDYRDAREILNLSQSMVARDTKIPRPYLSEFEHGKRSLDNEQLVELDEYYRCNGWEPINEAIASDDEYTVTLDDEDAVIDCEAQAEPDDSSMSKGRKVVRGLFLLSAVGLLFKALSGK